MIIKYKRALLFTLWANYCSLKLTGTVYATLTTTPLLRPGSIWASFQLLLQPQHLKTDVFP